MTAPVKVGHRTLTADMKLYIAGVVHNDPLGRTNLRRWLRLLRDSQGGPPAFVATEWDSQIFAEIKQQRDTFRNLASQEWPDAPPELVRELTRSLGYEADSHLDTFRGVDTLWLDEGRGDYQPEDVTEFAEARFNTYNSRLRDHRTLLNDTPGALAFLSQRAWQAADADPATTGQERDDNWVRAIRERIADGGGQWAVVIVGAHHATGNERYMRRQLEDLGLSCHVCMLR